VNERLVIVDTHPSHHHAALYRLLARGGLDPLVCYGSDFSVRRARSGTTASDLLAGYRHHFLAHADDGADAIEYAGTGDLAARVRGAGAALIMTSSGAFSRAAFRLCQAARTPILLRVDLVPPGPRARWRRALHDGKLRRTYARCPKLLYSGISTQDRLRQLGAASEQLVFMPVALDEAIYRATEADRFALRERARADLRVDENTGVLLFSGPLIEQKSPTLLLDGIAQFAGENRDRFVAVFNGEGPLRPGLQRRAENLGVRAIFPAVRSGGGQSTYHHAADLLVLPAPFEPWGSIVNEALLHGLPAVVSDGVGCHRDLIEPGVTGKVFEAGSAESLARAIERAVPLAGSPEARTACRSRIAAYSLAAAADAIRTAVTALQPDAYAFAGR